MADILKAQADPNDRLAQEGVIGPGDVLTALRQGSRGVVGGLGYLGQYLGIPAGETRNAAGEVVFPTNAFERGLQSTDTAAGQYAAAVMGPGGSKTPKATNVNLPELRGIPRDQAIAIASSEPHLIQGGAGTEGYYVGGPRNVKTPEDLAKIRSDYDAFVAKDPRGADWYDRTQRNIAEVTGNDPTQNTWMSRQHQVWSAGVSPESELAFALRENNTALAGMPQVGHYPAQHEAHMRAIAAQDPSLYPGGYKTGSYGTLIDPNQPYPPGAIGTNDFRAARNWGYTEPSGAPKTGVGITPTQSRFMDYETALAVDRLNKEGVAGVDWTGERAQAAPWVRQKAEALMENRGLDYESAFKEANKTIGDYFDKHTFNATHEAFPGSTTGHLPESVTAGNDARAAYSADPRSTWAFDAAGRDALYGGMAIPGTGVAMRVRPSTEMQGMYTPPGGPTELNPGWSARPLVSFEVGAGGGKSMTPGDRAIVEAGEATRGYIDAQNAAAGHVNWAGGPARESTSLFARMPGKATMAEILQAQAIGKPLGLPDVVDTGRGLTMTNFAGATDAKALTKALRSDLAKDISGVTGASEVRRVKTDPVYIDYVDAWQKGRGSDAATKQLLNYVERTPQIRTALNNNSMIAQKALGNLERDTEWSTTLGATRADIQKARAIIAEGPGWIDRLKANLGKGILPGIAGYLLVQAVKEPAQQ
jgi:hypothetical protein